MTKSTAIIFVLVNALILRLEKAVSYTLFMINVFQCIYFNFYFFVCSLWYFFLLYFQFLEDCFYSRSKLLILVH